MNCQPLLTDSSITLTNYANDSNILIPSENYLALEKDTTDAALAIANWFSENSLVLNLGKTNCITFTHSRNKQEYPPSINLSGTVISYALS